MSDENQETQAANETAPKRKVIRTKTVQPEVEKPDPLYVVGYSSPHCLDR